MKDQEQLPGFLEEVPERPVDADRVLSDEELKASGLQPVKAYVRTKAGKAAERQQRYREKKEAEGFKQTNVQVPEEHQETIREIARKLREGEPLNGPAPVKPAPKTEETPRPAVPKTPLPAGDPVELSAADRRLLEVARGEGLRSRLVRLLAGL